MEMVLLPEEAIKEELRSTIHEDDPKFKEVLRELRAELNTAGAHVQNIGAGGLALLISHEGEAREGDYVLLEEGSADPPLALGGLMGQIVAVEKMATPRQALLHLRFLPYDQALRREIIQMVYQQQEAPPELSAAGRKKRPSAPPKSD